MALLLVLCWALIFLLRLRFPPGFSLATINSLIFLEFLKKDNKVEFPISMTTEEFKNKLVEIYPKLKDRQFLLMKANESNSLERLNLAPSHYNAEDIYHSNLGRGRLYIQSVNELEVMISTFFFNIRLIFCDWKVICFIHSKIIPD